MKRLTYWCNDGMGSGEWRVNVKKYEDSGTHVDRLAAIEDILGDDYDLSRLRELVQADRDGAVCCSVRAYVPYGSGSRRYRRLLSKLRPKPFWRMAFI